MKKFNLVIGLLFIAIITMGAKIGDDTLRIGTKTGQDIEVQMGEGRLKWDSATSKIQFSNDSGSSVKDIGSGGGAGGGTNLILGENNDFESGDPPANWTASAGVFIASVGEGFGTQAGSWDAAAASDTLDSTVKAIVVGLENRSCNATIQYKYIAGSSGDYKLQAIATTAGLLAEIDLSVTSDWRKAAVQFTCPSSDSVKVRIISTVNGGVILLDDATIGRSDIVQISQTTLVAHAVYNNTSLCTWSRASASFGAFSVDTDCPAITVKSSSQAVNTADDDLPNIVFDSLLAKTYKVTATFSISASTAGESAVARITDGSTVGSECGIRHAGGDNVRIGNVTCIATFTYSTAGAKTFSLEGLAGSGNVELDNDFSGRELVWIVESYPLSSVEAITLETVGWHVDVNIGGANPNLGTAAQANYVEITDAGLDLVINTDKGSASAEIACASGTASEGLTCNGAAVNESVGLAFDIPTAGRYKACFEYTHDLDTGAAGILNVTSQIIETSNTSSAILSKGNSRAGIGTSLASSTMIHNINRCGEFVFNSAGQKTLRLEYEQTVSGAITNNLILADRAATLGQRDIHITVEQMDRQFPTPVFTDLTNSLNKKISSDTANLRVVSANITNSGTPTIDFQHDTWIDSLTDVGVGVVDINLVAGTFSSTDITCNVTDSETSSVLTAGRYIITDADNIDVQTLRTDTSTLTDDDFSITCFGPK